MVNTRLTTCVGQINSRVQMKDLVCVLGTLSCLSGEARAMVGCQGDDL